MLESFRRVFYDSQVIGVLRFIGLVNAAIWLGSAVFGAFVVLPGFFSPEMKAIIYAPYNGLAAQVIIHRYFCTHAVCATIAIAHIAAEFLYLGRPVDPLMAGALAVIIAFGLFEGAYLEPRLKSLFIAKYNPRSSVSRKAEASKTFGPLHGLSQGLNLVMVGGVCFYFWRIVRPVGGPRSSGFPKFGG